MVNVLLYCLQSGFVGLLLVGSLVSCVAVPRMEMCIRGCGGEATSI